MGADATVVTTVKFMEMGLFVAIAGPGIHLEDKRDAAVELGQFFRCVTQQVGKTIKCAAV